MSRLSVYHEPTSTELGYSLVFHARGHQVLSSPPRTTENSPPHTSRLGDVVPPLNWTTPRVGTPTSNAGATRRSRTNIQTGTRTLSTFSAGFLESRTLAFSSVNATLPDTPYQPAVTRSPSGLTACSTYPCYLQPYKPTAINFPLAFFDSPPDYHQSKGNACRYYRSLPTPARVIGIYAMTKGSFQDQVEEWLMACFSKSVRQDRYERTHRFLEEALELAQANGCTREDGEGSCRLCVFATQRTSRTRGWWCKSLLSQGYVAPRKSTCNTPAIRNWRVTGSA